MSPRRTLVITGTGTEVGKTIVTAAVAAVAVAAGELVTVVKPAQTGIGPGDEPDIDVVRRLARVQQAHELARYDAPLAPASAARAAGIAATPVPALAARIDELPDCDLLLLEGAGGLLVRLDGEDSTIADLARALSADVLVVAAAGLGTLNATALTAEALRRRDISCLGVVVGSWPVEPGTAELTNLTDLPAYAAAPLLGVIPAGAGSLPPETFLEVARAGLAPSLGGTWRREADSCPR